MSTQSVGGAVIPLVVQLGFFGSRKLFDEKVYSNEKIKVFMKELQDLLVKRLKTLREELKMEPQHFFCGISQVAIGGDMVFSRACMEMKIQQRIYLTQHRDEYLKAAGSAGPDFSESEIQDALEILNSPHVIQERIASEAMNRNERFDDVSLEIARISDVMICLVGEGADAFGEVGGTRQVIRRRKVAGQLLLEINVSIVNDRVTIADEGLENIEKFKVLDVPDVLSSSALNFNVQPGDKPESSKFCEVLNTFTEKRAQEYSNSFKRSARIIIGTHVCATICAFAALQLHGFAGLPWILGFELMLLAIGFWTHKCLHEEHATQKWAQARLLAELTRSVLTIGNLYVYLDFMFALPFPKELKAILRTVNVLQLSSARKSPSDWKEVRKQYLKNRLTDGPLSQLNFYSKGAEDAKRWMTEANWSFVILSFFAVAATASKLAIICNWVLVSEHDKHLVASWAGALAIVFPVLAVAGLSLAAAFDFEARHQTFEDIHKFLKGQLESIEKAEPEREFIRLFLETESWQLGETVNWSSRRAYTSVT